MNLETHTINKTNKQTNRATTMADEPTFQTNLFGKSNIVNIYLYLHKITDI